MCNKLILTRKSACIESSLVSSIRVAVCGCSFILNFLANALGFSWVSGKTHCWLLRRHTSFPTSDVRFWGSSWRVKLKNSFSRIRRSVFKSDINSMSWLTICVTLSSPFSRSSNVRGPRGTLNEINSSAPSTEVCGMSRRLSSKRSQTQSIPKEYTSVFLAWSTLNSSKWCSGEFHGLDFGRKTIPDSPAARVEYPKSVTFTVILLAVVFLKTNTFCGLISPWTTPMSLLDFQLER